MAILPFSARDRAEMYAFKKNLKINAILGGGYDGIVMSTDAGTAIKSLNNPRLYWNELSVYQRLKSLNLSSLSGFRIPKLIDFDDENYLIVMTLVKAPFVVDFASARLERPEPFDDDIVEYWHRQKREEFGDD